MIPFDKAWAGRCYTEECADARIDAFFFLLPLIVWAIFIWLKGTDLRDYPKSYTKSQRLGWYAAFLITFVIAWSIPALLF
jgi:hypothetical protein